MFVFFIRLILFLIALSAIKWVLNYGRRLWNGIQLPARRTESAPTVLEMDPVCGTYVAADSSFKKIAGGKVYHFCSVECRNRFAA